MSGIVRFAIHNDSSILIIFGPETPLEYYFVTVQE